MLQLRIVLHSCWKRRKRRSIVFILRRFSTIAFASSVDRGSSFWRNALSGRAASLTRADEAEEDVRANLQRRTNVPADKLFAFSPAGISSCKSSAVIFSVAIGIWSGCNSRSSVYFRYTIHTTKLQAARIFINPFSRTARIYSRAPSSLLFDASLFKRMPRVNRLSFHITIKSLGFSVSSSPYADVCWRKEFQ